MIPYPALQILSAYRFHVWNMAGKNSSRIRQSLMQSLTGEKRPLAKCGCNALYSILRETLKPEPDCIAGMDRQMEQKMFAAFQAGR